MQEEYGIPVRMLQRMMTGFELTETYVYRDGVPHWSERLLDALAYIMWMYYRANTENPTLTPDDFRIDYSAGEKQSQDQMEFNARQWVKSCGGNIGDDSNASDKANDKR